jgi:hypothetical protein
MASIWWRAETLVACRAVVSARHPTVNRFSDCTGDAQHTFCCCLYLLLTQPCKSLVVLLLTVLLFTFFLQV